MSDNKDPKKTPGPLGPKNPRIMTYIITIVIWALFSSILLPNIAERSIEKVPYNQFISMVDKGEVEKVQIDDKVVSFNKTGEAEDQIYQTGRVQDDTLTQRLIDKGVTFERIVPREFSPIITFLLQFILPMVLIFGLLSLLSKSMMKKMGSGSMNFGKSNAKIYVETENSKTFGDVAGQTEAKEDLLEIVNFLHDPGKYTQIGAVLPKGVLLVGPPGTGKTLLARAVAGEAKVPFFSISGSEFVEMFVGMGASKVRDLFKQAKEKAPCIIFIDEIDAIGKRRDVSGFSSNDEREQTLNQLLSEMDGFDGNEGIVILAATNRPEILDPALTRPGRFDRRVPVELSDLKGREEILKVHAKKVKTEEDINYRDIALLTAGASGAQLANIINEAALRAVKNGRDKVSQEDLQESVEVVIAGQQKKGMVISPKEKELIAYHEVGHALVAAMQTHSAPVTKITIIPRTSGALGYTMQVDQEEKFLMSKEEIFNKIVTTTGGRAAEEVVFKTKTTGASNDIEQITKMARAMVTQYGMSDEFGMVQLESGQSKYMGGGTNSMASQRKASEIDDEVEGIIKSAHEKAKKILEDNIDKLHEISKFLIQEETITGEQFMNILDLQDTGNSEEVHANSEIEKDNIVIKED